MTCYLSRIANFEIHMLFSNETNQFKRESRLFVKQCQ